MRTKRSKAKCKQCGKAITLRAGDPHTPIAHKCPHGRRCVEPAWSRRAVEPCAACEQIAHAETMAAGAAGGEP